MNFIIYHLDSLSPLAIKRKDNLKFENEKITDNFISLISKDSIFFKNLYSFGETWSTTFEYFTNGNMLSGYGDAFHCHKSFKSEYSIAKIFKEKKFTTFLYRDQKDFPNKGFYKRYFDSLSKDFDHICLSKEGKIKSLKDFLKENKNNFFEKKNKMFLIHDYSLHDNDMVYYKPTAKNYLRAVNLSAKKIKNNLKVINYNKKKDILVLLSDHGLNLYPESKIHFDKYLNRNEYQKYYLSLLEDSKIKSCFFIKAPGLKARDISRMIVPKDVFGVLTEIVRLNFVLKKIPHLFKKIKYINNKITVSVRAAVADPYNNFFFKEFFHCHLINIGPNLKISYSLGHPNPFYDFIKKKHVNFKKNEKFDLNQKIFEYYSLKNIINKIILLLFSYVHRLRSFL